MKKLFFPLVILLAGYGALAQDIITTKNGEDIRARVIGLTDTEVEYKKFDETNGTVYTIPKSKLVVIHYENGSKEVFSDDSGDAFKALGSNPSYEGTPKEIRPKVETPKVEDPTRASKYTKYRKMKKSGIILTVIGTIAFVGGMAALSETETYSSWDDSTRKTFFGAFSVASGTVGVCVGIPLWIAGAANQKKYRPQPNVSVYISPSLSNKGLALRIRF